MSFLKMFLGNVSKALDHGADTREALIYIPPRAHDDNLLIGADFHGAHLALDIVNKACGIRESVLIKISPPIMAG